MKKEILEITDVAYGGAGVARKDGKVYFVDDVVTGDIVEVEITRDRDRYAEAKPIRRITPSPLRSPSECAYSDRCGGCQWHGIPYEQQLQWKGQFIAAALKRIGGMGDWTDIKVMASPELFHYRNRIHLKGRIRQDGTLAFGYFARGSRDFVGVDHCKIADQRINELMMTAMSHRFRDIPEQPFKVEIQAADGLLLSVFPENPKRITELAPLIDYFRTLESVAWVDVIQQAKHASFHIYDRWRGIDFYTQPGLFQQVNLQHNHTLRNVVIDLVKPLKAERILDVYCGSGNLTLPMAQMASYVEGIEFSGAAINCGKFTAAKNNIQNVNFLTGDGVAHLWKVARDKEHFDLVVVDPPREGLYKGVNPLQLLAPEHVIYVSCDPTTLARDLGRMVRKGYAIESLQGLDFFPNTFHVETVAYLRRSAG